MDQHNTKNQTLCNAANNTIVRLLCIHQIMAIPYYTVLLDLRRCTVLRPSCLSWISAKKIKPHRVFISNMNKRLQVIAAKVFWGLVYIRPMGSGRLQDAVAKDDPKLAHVQISMFCCTRAMTVAIKICCLSRTCYATKAQNRMVTDIRPIAHFERL